MGRLLYVVLVLAALAAGAAYLVFNYVDVVVKVALEHWGPDLLGAPVKVGEVQISVQSGRGAIRELEIGNPSGFTARRAARFGEIRVSVDPMTLTDRLIVIHEITVDSPQITYEKGNKATNLDAIQSSIDAYLKRATAQAPPGNSGAADGVKRRFVIERLSIKGGKVLMTTAGLKGQGVAFDLPAVELRDIGKDRGGVTASEAAALVASVLQNRIAQKVLTNMDLLRRGGVEGAVDALKGLLK